MQLAPRTRQQMDGGYCFLPTGSGDLGGGVSLFTQMRMEDWGGGGGVPRSEPCPLAALSQGGFSTGRGQHRPATRLHHPQSQEEGAH